MLLSGYPQATLFTPHGGTGEGNDSPPVTPSAISLAFIAVDDGLWLLRHTFLYFTSGFSQFFLGFPFFFPFFSLLGHEFKMELGWAYNGLMRKSGW